VDLPGQVRVLAALAAGCGSTSWVASVYSVCTWLTGRWSYNSGCLHAHWDALAALAEGPDAPPGPQLSLVPMSELSVSDDWHPSGLAGTGSNTVTADGVFVPAHRMLPASS
jgi:alkylation response protein AidB-like acyl-CoA dehydrogenase